MVAARFRDYYDKQARARHEKLSGRPADGKPVENLPQDTGKARDAAGKEFGVSGKSVDHATKVLEKGVPELVAAMDAGTVAVSTAAKLAQAPVEVQRTARPAEAGERGAGRVGGTCAKFCTSYWPENPPSCRRKPAVCRAAKPKIQDLSASHECFVLLTIACCCSIFL